jgi:hypothetical protein
MTGAVADLLETQRRMLQGGLQEGELFVSAGTNLDRQRVVILQKAALARWIVAGTYSARVVPS